MTTTTRRRSRIVVLAGIAILAALWMLAISPKREERAKVKANVAAQEARLQTAQAQLASFEAAKKAVPRQARRAQAARQGRAGSRRDLVAAASAAAPREGAQQQPAARRPQAGPAAPAGADGTRLTPGATVGPDGLAALPFTFEFTGEYFDLRDILATVRRSVSVRKDKIKVGGRLLTIDGLSFTRTDPSSTRTKATLNATAYIAPDGASTPQPPAAAAATTPATPSGGS